MDVTENEERRSEEPLENTIEEQSAHIERKENKFCISFDMSVDSWFETLQMELAKHLNGAVDKCPKGENLMRLRKIFSIKDSPEQINMELSKNKHEECDSRVSIKETPKLGTFIPKDLHEFLDNSYVIFDFDYEFMALEIEDPALCDDTDRGTGDELDSTYIFVQIIRKVEPSAAHPLLQEYEIHDGTDDVRVVKSCKLFKFVRKRVANSEQENTVTTPEDISNGEMKSASQTSSLKYILKDIRQCLEETRKEPLLDRRRIFKRLLLKWHPDKNSDNVSMCTEIFQYIQQCLYRLEKGMALTDDGCEDKGGSDFVDSTAEFWSNFWVGRFLERHENERKSHEQNKSSETYDEFDGFWNAGRSQFTGSEPQPYHYCAEARRWQKQAVIDIDNGRTSLLRIPSNSFNWVCYMAHQAAEKSMKAAWYAKDANKIHNIRYSHSLSTLAFGLGSNVEQLAGNLTRLTGEHTKMRYPDAFYGQQIPSESFNRQTAETVVSVAKQIIDIVQRCYIK